MIVRRNPADGFVIQPRR